MDKDTTSINSSKEEKLILGGVEIPHDKGLLGHSDADVLLHAITDAVLGAAALGDIGKHFPDTDDKYKGADSEWLLAEAMQKVHDKGYKLVNLDSTVIAQKPKAFSLYQRNLHEPSQHPAD